MDKTALDQLRIERKPEGRTPRRRWPAAVVVLLVLGAAAATWYFWFWPAGTTAVHTIPAREAGDGGVATVLNASGYVTARRRATVSSKFTGKVIEVLIEEGMQVDEGQVLARLDDSNVRASFQLAEAQLISARQALKETDALLREARLNFDRISRLVEKDLASESELDRSRALAVSLEAKLDHKQADIGVAERQLDIYRQQLEDTIIRAPFDGIVVAKNAQPGEMISPISAGGGFTRTGIGTIVDMSSLEIEIDVNEAYINRVKPGQEVVATLDAYPDWKIPSHVIAIIPTADRQRATVEVRVGFDELDERVLPDMGVKVAFREVEGSPPAAGSGTGILVPREAISSQDDRDYLFVVSGGRAERRAVSIGETRGQDILVTGGLSPGERIVVRSQGELVNGQQVRELEK